MSKQCGEAKIEHSGWNVLSEFNAELRIVFYVESNSALNFGKSRGGGERCHPGAACATRARNLLLESVRHVFLCQVRK